ncbi:ATP-binding protein [Actinosynnema sp. NPDC020468]|uniref:ATP-binding protein n=1 Tax=Actinosynnema sp. NPDC020468 TaxID=3154488 RepID=UPI0033FB2966
MSGHQGTSPHNPFSPNAVARIADKQEREEADVTVVTDAIRRAEHTVRSYVERRQSDAEGRPEGAVVLILGEYGTGKTHLARHLVRFADSLLGNPDSSLHIEATAETLARVYERMTRSLGRERVRARVSDFYADIVAKQLQETGLAGDAVALLRSREVEPQRVVRQLRLIESALLRDVLAQLRAVTEDDMFGQALTLMLKPQLEEVVWAWLTGGEPAQALVDRGITRRISGLTEVLDAMGVLALLFGGSRTGFLLVIDEFDKIFTQATEVDGSVATAFQSLLEVFLKAGACLVLCGSPSFWEAIDPSTAQRIVMPVEMPNWSTEQAREYVELAQAVEFGGPRLAPFTRETVDYLVNLTAGNPRQVIRMCHRLYRAAGPDGEVTVDLVRDESRQLWGALRAEDVEAAARRVLDANGWTYQRDHYVTVNGKVDYWITFGDRTGACAVLFSESVLDQADVDEVLRRVVAVREAQSDVEMVLVVHGVVAGEQAVLLRGPLGGEPLTYRVRSFAEDFKAAVQAAVWRLPSRERGDSLGSLHQRLDQVNRQYASLHGFVEQLAEHVDGVRSAADRQFGAVRQQLTDVQRRIGTPVAESAAPVLPASVEQLFRAAVDALDSVTQLDVMLTEAFGPEPDPVLSDVQTRVYSKVHVEAFGVANLVSHAVRAFQAAVERWYRETDAVARPVDREAESGLDDLCRSYDAVTEYLPLYRLYPLADQPWTQASGPMADIGRPNRQADLHLALDDLSARVRDAVLRPTRSGG